MYLQRTVALSTGQWITQSSGGSSAWDAGTCRAAADLWSGAHSTVSVGVWNTGVHGAARALGQGHVCSWGWGMTTLVPGQHSNSSLCGRCSSISVPKRSMMVMAIGYFNHKSCWCLLWSRLLGSVLKSTTAVKNARSLLWSWAARIAGVLHKAGYWKPWWQLLCGC